MIDIPPPVLHRLGQLQRRGAARAFAAAALDPAAAQRARLRHILEDNRDTEVGRAWDFAGIGDVDAYRRAVPIHTPEAVAPYVERMMRGEASVLTRERPEYWVRTTGSTGTPKHVPITDGYRAELQTSVHVALWHLYRRFPAAFRGRALYFVGSPKLDVAPDGTPVGTMSGYNFGKMPPIVRALYAWPAELFEVPDLATRNWLALHLALCADVTMMVGIFPASIVYLLRDLEELLDELSFHVERGALPARLVLDEERRAFFAARLRPRPDVAARLREAKAMKRGEICPHLFPRLALTYCWTSSTAGAFVPELQQHLGPRVPIRDAIYSACEGWCSIPMGDEAPGGALAVTSHFFEFIEESAYEAGGRDTVLAHELEDGKRYFILFSTSGGMYRYLLGDVVEVTGRFPARAGKHGTRGTPTICFVRKAGAAANLVGEKLDEAHATMAVGEALAAAASGATFFTLAPEPGRARPGYALYLEPAPGVTLDDERLRSVARRVDEGLSRLAADYGRLRKGQALLPVVVRLVPAGAYREWRQERVHAGVAEPQIKVAHLCGDVDKVPALIRHRAGAPVG